MKRLSRVACLMMALVFMSSCFASAGALTANSWFYKPAYGEKGAVAYAAFNAAVDASDTKWQAMYVAYTTWLAAAQDPGHKHSKLWASDGSPEAVTVDAVGSVSMRSAACVGYGLLVDPTVTVSSLFGFGLMLQPTVVAAANGDRLHGLYINPTFTVGAFTGVTKYALYVPSADPSYFAGSIGIGTAVPAAKLELKDGSFYLSDADVTHGMTDVVPTNVFGAALPHDATAGGLRFVGLSDGDAGGLGLYGIIGAADPTDTVPAVKLVSGKANSTVFQAVGAAETAFQFVNYTTALMTVLGNGNVGIGTVTPGSKLAVVGLATHADNAAARAAGLATGDFYRTATGVVMVVYTP